MKFIQISICILAFLASSELMAQDAKWLAKQPAFGRSKSLIRTQDRWEEERGRIWISISFHYPISDGEPLKYCGAVPGIAGSDSTRQGDLFEAANNQVVEYVTKSGQVYWVTASGWQGISDTHVPTCESAQRIRLYDKEGTLIGDFKADPTAVPPRWEPFISEDGILAFTRITGGEKDFWAQDHTIKASARLSGDGGMTWGKKYTRPKGDGNTTWVDFAGIVDTKPRIAIPEELKDKPELLVEIVSTKDMAIEVTRYKIITQIGSKGVKLP